ncbi:MAG: SDR family oxidoreductase [Terracidiphilus sp.]|jgi:NAD(P)-dependent dehydrogenase (short-subunit alcohol dehydrogenase family)
MANIVVTGTSKGIGLVTALTLARAGHTVYATMRNPARAPELAETAAKENLPIHVSAMDVDSDESVTSGFAAIFSKAGEIDVLVNNAGIAVAGATEELSLADFRAVMETNYFGALRCIKEVIPRMRKRRSGVIINVTSIAGKLSTSPLGAYAATKFALEAVSESLAQEMKLFDVHVAIVEPGVIDTQMANSIDEPVAPTLYPGQRRMANYFAAALRNPTPPLVVAETIQHIIESGTWQLRHPAGPEAAGALASRAATPDEAYIAVHGLADDNAWYDIMEQNTGMKIRPEN